MSYSPDFVKRFEKVFQQYSISRNALILPSQYEGFTEVHVAPLNEFRNALFHVFKSFDKDEDYNIELKAASIHYIRAQYDAFEIYINESLKEINNCFNDIDPTIVNEVFERYYSVIIPTVNEMKYKLTEERTSRRKDTEKANDLIFEKYELIKKFKKEIADNTEFVILEVKRKRLSNIKHNLIGMVISIAVGIVIGLLTAYITGIVNAN